MLLVIQDTTSLHLKSGSVWKSFEQFRREGQSALLSVKDGSVATLCTKHGQYRIMEEKDFQQIYGLASEIDRLRGGLRVISSAIRAVKKHPDDETIKVLVESAKFIGSIPELPVRSQFSPLEPENFEDDDDDEHYILDPCELERLINEALSIQNKIN